MKVSICIPTYNRLNYLQELIDSCLRQLNTNFEICISQDITPTGLNPDIKAYCESLLISYPDKVTYIAQSVNLGLAGNWNALLSMAQGEYVFIPGDDDLISSDFLEKLIYYGKNADVIFCNQQFINEENKLLLDKTVELNNTYGRTNLVQGILTDPIRTVLRNSVPMSASLIRREWFNKFRFDNRINTPELEVFLKIAVSGGKFYYLDEQLASFRLHNSSATSYGLTIGQFLSNLIDIKVPFEFEKDKAKLISSAIIPGINNALRYKNKALANKLFYSNYYPANQPLKKLIQFILLLIPSFITSKLLLK